MVQKKNLGYTPPPLGTHKDEHIMRASTGGTTLCASCAWNQREMVYGVGLKQKLLQINLHGFRSSIEIVC